MHQNAFGDRALLGPAEGDYSSSPGPLIAGLRGRTEERRGEDPLIKMKKFGDILLKNVFLGILGILP